MCHDGGALSVKKAGAGGSMARACRASCRRESAGACQDILASKKASRPLHTGMMTMPCRSCRLFGSLLLFQSLHTSLGFSILLTSSYFSRKDSQKQEWRLFSLTDGGGASNNNNNNWKKDLLDTFSGDFDNYEQVVEDHHNSLFPREGGGHEQIHCTLIPLTPTTRLAAFYFDGMPNKIFRFRYYQLLIEDEDHVNMKLYTLLPSLEQELRATSDPTEWPRVFDAYKAIHPDEVLVKELPKCDVQWSRDMDPVQHKYALEHFNSSSSELSFHAVMIYGQALVDSTMIPGQEILIKDQLSLSKDDFWIHDRGYNPTTGDYIYGNQRGIPYQLKRVTRINTESGKREVCSKKLQWTLGEEWRTDDEYQHYMQQLGGVSSKLNS